MEKEKIDDEVYVISSLDGNNFRLPKRYELIDIIGQGSYGVVVSAKDNDRNELIAIKKNKNVYPVYFPLDKTDKEVIDKTYVHRSVTSQKRILREFRILSHIGKHPNIVTVKDTVLPESFEMFSDVYFIMDLMECDLKTIIESDQELTNEHFRFFMYQILIALNFIHSVNIFHRDLKPENILLNSDCELKLCDFGLARYIEDNQDMSTSFVVSRWYRSPELLLANQKINKGAIDMWSCGCIFAELLLRKVLFPGINPVDQLQKIIQIVGSPNKSDIKACCDSDEARRFLGNFRNIKRISFKKLLPKADPDGIDLLNKMLQLNPNNRISAKDSLQHKYFKCYFSSLDLAPNPMPFDHSFEDLNDSKSLKKACYNAVVNFYKKKKRETSLLKLRKNYKKITRGLDSPIIEYFTRENSFSKTPVEKKTNEEIVKKL